MASKDRRDLRPTEEAVMGPDPLPSRSSVGLLRVPERYEDRGRLGRGGQGVVHRVWDRELEREVALKTVHADRLSPEARSHFLQEARSAAGLEHPNIVPIHDVGALPDGRPYYTMRLVTGRSLAAVLDGLVAAQGEATAPLVREWTIVRLAQVIQQICLALQAAHDRGVIHRDVKPSNVLLGDLGEALIVDWGIAKSSSDEELDAAPTTTGVIKGTVTYLAPERARGKPAGPPADIYAVGVVLYECLTLEFPFDGQSNADVLAAILRDEPIAPAVRTPERRVPPELSDLAMRLLRKDPAARLATARDVADELQAFLEGARERERQLASAAELERAGREAWASHAAALEETERVRKEIERLEEGHPTWQPVPQKRELVAARRRVEELERSSWRSFLDGVNRFTDALVHVPEHEDARRALADEFWARFRQSEELRQPLLAETYRMLVERWHDGRYAKALEGHGSLDLTVSPADAELTLHALVEEDLVLVDGPGRPLGRGPISLPDLPMGTYVVAAKAPGHEPARMPVCIRRGEAWRGSLRLVRAGRLPEGWVYIPGTEAWLGGPAGAAASYPRHRATLPSFAIRRHPVTMAEYCAFLDEQEGDVQDSGLVPEVVTIGAVCGRDGEGRWQPFHGERASELLDYLSSEERRRVPVVGIVADAARAFAAWAAKKMARPVRLPTSDEWELAARGVDERVHPWGSAFDPALCLIRESFAGQPDLRPVEAVPTDCSVYGVRDLAGSVSEFTASWANEEREMVELRGSGWGLGEPLTRCAAHASLNKPGSVGYLGFRLVMDLGDADLA